MKEGSESLKNLLKQYEGRLILIVCANSYKYKAHNLKVFDDYVTFEDKFGGQVILSLSEIISVQEIEK